MDKMMLELIMPSVIHANITQTIEVVNAFQYLMSSFGTILLTDRDPYTQKLVEIATYFLRGLTFSGHATRTTAGNSGRMMLRIILLALIYDVHDFIAVIGGDDVYIWFLRTADRDRF
jgi:hypothetical protein